MIARFLMLIRRELWEHRALVVAPGVIGVLILLAFAIFMLSSSIVRGIGFETIIAGFEAAEKAGAAHRFSAVMLAPVGFFIASLLLTNFFYALDALYAERKDRSILFWRSLPITDIETVISKLIVAAVVAPLITFAVLGLTQLGIMLISTVFVWLGDGSALDLIWRPAPVLETWGMSLFSLVALGLWSLPFLAWLLLCSAFVRKSPFLWAVLPFVVIPLLESLAFDSAWFVRNVWGHLGRFFSSSFRITDSGGDLVITSDAGTRASFSPASFVDPGQFVTAPELWIGFGVGALLTAAAIWVRRYRPDVEA